MERNSGSGQLPGDIDYADRIDACIQDVLYRGSHIENARTLMTIAQKADELNSREDPITRPRTLGFHPGNRNSTLLDSPWNNNSLEDV